jgi:hypothetical protein
MRLILITLILALSAIAQAPPFPQLPEVTVELCKPAVVESNELASTIESVRSQGCEVEIRAVNEYWLVYGVRIEGK